MPLKTRILIFAWFVYFCSLPLFKSFASIAEVSLAILTFWPGTLSGFKQAFLNYKAVAGIAAVFFVLIFGMFYTEDLDSGWKVLKHQHRFLVIPFLALAHAGLLQKYFRQLLLAFIWGAAVACLFTIVLYLLPENTVQELANSTNLLIDYPVNSNRTAFGLYTPFIDRIQFGSITAVAIICCIYLVSEGYKRSLFLVILPLLFYTMLILGGRGAQVALFVALLVYAVSIAFMVRAPKPALGFRNTKRYVLIFTAGLILFLGLPYLSYKTIMPLQSRVHQTMWEIGQIENGTYRNHDYQHFTTLRRIVSIKNMWQLAKEDFWFGTGTGDYKNELINMYARNTPDMPVNNHSQYLFFWAMNGLIGLAVFLGVLFFWLKHLSKGPRLVYLFGSAFLVYYMVNMLPDAVLYTQVDSSVFCTFLALIGLQGNLTTDLT